MPLEENMVLIAANGKACPFSAEVAKLLNQPLMDAQLQKFMDGESHCQIECSVRGKHVFLIHTCQAPVNENILDVLIIMDALKRASAASISLVLPYFPYARQDRKSSPRSPISAKLMADLFTTAGATRVMSLDLHSTAIQGFFNIPIDDLSAEPLFVAHIQKHYNLKETVVVSPDVGGVVRARQLAEHLSTPLAIVDKRRPAPNEAEVKHVIGDVAGQTCLLIDDMVDTGKTLIQSAQFLIQQAGAKNVIAYATHGVLSGDAIQNIESSHLEKLVLSNTLPLKGSLASANKIETLSVAGIIAEEIARTIKRLKT